MKAITGLLFTMLALCLGPAPAWADVNLKFGVYTSEKPSAMVKIFRPVLNVLEEDMSAQLGETVSIRMQVANSYEKGINQLTTGAIDFARLGPASYIIASEENPNIKLLAMEAVKGKKRFRGVIAVHRDSEIKTIADLTGKHFAFGSERSTIGRYLSQRYLLENGVHASDLSSYEYLGRHDKVGAAVAAGLFDAGALKEGTFIKMVKKSSPLRELASFENVTKPWAARAGLDGRLFNALKSGLLKLQDKVALNTLRKSGFLAGSDKDYEMVRTAMNSNLHFFNKP